MNKPMLEQRAERQTGAMAQPVVLAHTAPFDLGGLRVEPALRRVTRPDGAATTLEPLVMQVLIAFAEAEGETLSRDDLIERCWNQRIVGDDSIARVILRLRKLAGGFAQGAFAIETIAKVGFRLTVEGAGERSALRAADSAGRGWDRRLLLKGAAASIALAGAGTLAWKAATRSEPIPEAMRLYRRGIENRGQASLQQSEQSVSYLREAVRIDPGFAEAWGALAWGYRGLLAYGDRPDAATIKARARSAANRALELDPDNLQALSALLLLEPFYRRWAEVETGCRNLLARHPQDSILEYNLAVVLGETGRIRASIPYLSAVAAREPFWPLPSLWLVQALMASGRIEEAEDLLDQASRRWPRRLDWWLARDRLLLMTGRASDARAFVDDVANRPIAEDELVRMELVVSGAIAGSARNAIDQAVSAVLEFVSRRPPATVYGVFSLAMLGALDQAFELLRGYYFGRGRWARHRAQAPRTEFLFGLMSRSLRADDRFAGLVNEIGLQTYWRQSGHRPDYLAGQ